jgi:hypothetical protein
MGKRLGGRGTRLAVLGLVAGLSLVSVAEAVAQTATYPPSGRKLPRWNALPDWNGLWERDGDLVWDNRIPAGVAQPPPYNAEYQKIFDGPGGRQGVGRNGMPGMTISLYPIDIQINPGAVVILSENELPRRIYTDGRLHPPEPIPNSTGHSIGEWKGKELHVDTCCVNQRIRLPGGGPHSDAMRIKERYWAPTPNTLMAEITVEDPKAFTKPWTTVKTWYRRADWEPVEYNREENNRDAPRE